MLLAHLPGDGRPWLPATADSANWTPYAATTFGSATIFAYLTHWLFLPHSEKKALRWIDFTAKNFDRRSSVEFAIQLKHGGRMVGLVGRNPNLEP